jgi:hypothetical protein
LGFYLHSAGFLSVALDTLFFHVEPAYFFGWAGGRVRYFYSPLLRLDFRSLYIRGGLGNLNYRVGRLVMADTGDLVLDAFGRGYDALSIVWEGERWRYLFTVMKLEVWVSDGDYYFNPDATSISAGQRVDRYGILRTLTFGNLSFSEMTVLSTLAGNFPDVRAFNPLLPGYLYQWFYSKEVNVLWEVSYRLGRNTLRIVIDDFPYLPSWFSIVPPTVGLRLSGDYGVFSYDGIWITAFTYANRRPWDALYEAPHFGGDYARLSTKFLLPGEGLRPSVELGVWAKGRYNGVLKEPQIGSYPPFAFLHAPVRYDGWVSLGLRKGGAEVQVGYGSKPLSVGFGRIFVWFSYIR